jgi:magnesium-transporting ATPase (P-type)
MITGDNVVTATNIAEQVGILSERDEHGQVMTAGQLMD